MVKIIVGISFILISINTRLIDDPTVFDCYYLGANIINGNTIRQDRSFLCGIENFKKRDKVVFFDPISINRNKIVLDELNKRIIYRSGKVKTYAGANINKFFNFVLTDKNLKLYKIETGKDTFLILESRISGATQYDTLMKSYLILDTVSGDTRLFESLGDKNSILGVERATKSISTIQFLFSDRFRRSGITSMKIVVNRFVDSKSLILENEYDDCRCK